MIGQWHQEHNCIRKRRERQQPGMGRRGYRQAFTGLVRFDLICNDLTRLVFYGGSVLPEWHNTAASARCLRKEIQENATGERMRTLVG